METIFITGFSSENVETSLFPHLWVQSLKLHGTKSTAPEMNGVGFNFYYTVIIQGTDNPQHLSIDSVQTIPLILHWKNPIGQQQHQSMFTISANIPRSSSWLYGGGGEDFLKKQSLLPTEHCQLLSFTYK